MKRRFAVSLAAAVIAFIMILIGIHIAPKKPVILSDPISVYKAAANNITNQPHLQYRIQTNTAVSSESETFHEHSDILLQYEGNGTERFRLLAQEAFSSGSLKAEITELFCNGQLYVTVSDGKFTSHYAQSDIVQRYVPPTLFDCNLYGSVHGVTDNGYTTITFCDPTAAENWALPQGATFQRGSGTVYLDNQGNLVKSQYEITYAYQLATVTKAVTVEILGTEIVTISQPADVNAYITIDCIDAPRMLEHASGQLTQLQSAYVHYEEYIFCQAFGDERTKETDVLLRKTTPLDVEVDTTITLTNKSIGTETTAERILETFSDGSYVNTQNGTQNIDPSVTEPIMLEYCQNTFLGTITLPQYIAGVTTAEDGDTIRIVFTGNDLFAESISQNICQTLYGDPTILNSLATDHYTKLLECYIELDSQTGRIRSSGIQYSSIYSIDGFPYALEFRANQTYDR